MCNEIWSSAEKIHNIMSRDSLQFPDFLVSKTRKISSSKFSNLFSLSCLDDGIGRNLVTQTSLFLVCYWARWRAARHELWGFSDALATLHSLEKFDPYPIFWFSWKNAFLPFGLIDIWPFWLLFRLFSRFGSHNLLSDLRPRLQSNLWGRLRLWPQIDLDLGWPQFQLPRPQEAKNQFCSFWWWNIRC